MARALIFLSLLIGASLACSNADSGSNNCFQCGDFCMDPDSDTCWKDGQQIFAKDADANLICDDKDELRCGHTCFDPAKAKCYVGTVTGASANIDGEVVCLLDNKYQRCGGGCYDTTASLCFNGVTSISTGSDAAGDVVCPTGWNRCGNGCWKTSDDVCFVGTTKQTSGNFEESNAIPCPKARRRCGNQCYDEVSDACWDGATQLAGSTDYTTGDLICKKNDVRCGCKCMSSGDKCYLAGALQSGPTADADAIVCSGGKSNVCGAGCFDPANDYCFPDGSEVPDTANHEKGIICDKDEKLCGTQCYDPANTICIQGSTPGTANNKNGELVCLSAMFRCGSTCVPNAPGRCFEGTVDKQGAHTPGGIPCVFGSGKRCGQSCYYPGAIFVAPVKCIVGDLTQPDGEISYSSDSAIPCYAGQERCGPYCYTTADDVCYEGTTLKSGSSEAGNFVCDKSISSTNVNECTCQPKEYDIPDNSSPKSNGDEVTCQFFSDNACQSEVDETTFEVTEDQCVHVKNQFAAQWKGGSSVYFYVMSSDNFPGDCACDGSEDIKYDSGAFAFGECVGAQNTYLRCETKHNGAATLVPSLVAFSIALFKLFF